MNRKLREFIKRTPLYPVLREARSRFGRNSDGLDKYVLSKPSDQNVIDVFQGTWASRLPDEFGLVTKPGESELFDDDRVAWIEEVFGAFTDWNILELGPLEGGHSYMLHNRNAKKIVSVEANTRSFLKCLCVKEVLKLDRVEFKLGDFMAYLKTDTEKYDMVLASGVLYHMSKPIELLEMISRVSERLFIWTHYFDEEAVRRNNLAHKFNPVQSFDHKGVTYKYSTQLYKGGHNWSGFYGGPEAESKWLTKKSLLEALDQFGFTDIKIRSDNADHPNGPTITLCASKAVS